MTIADDAIFDSLAHPTLSGRWLGRETPSGFSQLAEALGRTGYRGACAIGLHGVEGYAHEAFIAQCRQYPKLVPIAGFDPVADASLEAMRRLRELGFRGIKIHPRFSGLTQALGSLAPALHNAGTAGLTVFLCTYLHCEMQLYPRTDPLHSLAEALAQAPATRVVLVHGGDVQLMRYAELVRHNPRLLLDLSMTLMKYEGSSVDADIGFLFRSFDRRICVGTDWPEYQPEQVRRRFEDFAADLSPVKRRNIASENLLNFLGVADEFAH